jgi:hypothetical protein
MHDADISPRKQSFTSDSDCEKAVPLPRLNPYLHPSQALSPTQLAPPRRTCLLDTMADAGGAIRAANLAQIRRSEERKATGAPEKTMEDDPGASYAQARHTRG